MVKILIGHDGSPAADAAVADLKNAGLPQQAQALILIACQALTPIGILSPDGLGGAAFALAYAKAVQAHKSVSLRCRRRAETAARKLRKRFQRWKISTRVVVDSPAHALLDTADRWKPDLLVMGSKGWSEFGGMAIGSVADKVINHARCAVRLGRPRPERKGPPRLVIGYDGSPYSDAALNAIALRPWPKGTRARLVAVSEIPFGIYDLPQEPAEPFPMAESPWAWMEKKLAKAVARLERAGIRAGSAILMGEPRRALLDLAEKEKADAIILGSHGYSGLRRIMLGSVSASVAAHAKCSVEIIHRKAPKRG